MSFFHRFQLAHVILMWGCYRYPPGCIPDQCDFLMTFKPDSNTVVEFNISVSVTNANMRWAAVGFSTDNQMVTF